MLLVRRSRSFKLSLIVIQAFDFVFHCAALPHVLTAAVGCSRSKKKLLSPLYMFRN
jgi:hypothetical protein